MQLQFNSVEMYCPNCGKKISAISGKDDVFKFHCSRCGTVIVSKKHTPKKFSMKVVNNN